MCRLPKPTRIRQVCNNYPSSINTKPQEQRKKIQRVVTLTLWRTKEKRKYSPVQWYFITDKHCPFKLPTFRSFILLLSAAYSCRRVWSAAGKMGTKGSENSGRKPGCPMQIPMDWAGIEPYPPWKEAGYLLKAKNEIYCLQLFNSYPTESKMCLH
jgi:hypothetical protein